MTPDSDGQSGWTRWLRFRLRSLLVLLTVFSLMMAIWTVVVRPYRDQMNAMAILNKTFAGEMTFEDTRAVGPAWHEWLVTKMLGEQHYREIIALDLSVTGATADQLRSLGDLRFLEQLSLDRTKADDAVVISLFRLSQLKSLSLSYTPITDRGLKGLSNHPQLEILYLTGTAISDDSISSLTQISTLRQLYVRWSAFSQQGIESLKAASAGCEIHSHLLVTRG